MEEHGFTKDWKIGSRNVFLAPGLYGGESTGDDATVTKALQAVLRKAISDDLIVFVLHAENVLPVAPPSWLPKASVWYPGQH
ncbi:hypothetical protein [Terriglobus aquaticus]